VFEGDRDGYTLVYSTQAAVLHTLNRIGTHLDLNGIED
jgi:hypothetical protein